MLALACGVGGGGGSQLWDIVGVRVGGLVDVFAVNVLGGLGGRASFPAGGVFPLQAKKFEAVMELGEETHRENLPTGATRLPVDVCSKAGFEDYTEGRLRANGSASRCYIISSSV